MSYTQQDCATAQIVIPASQTGMTTTAHNECVPLFTYKKLRIVTLLLQYHVNALFIATHEHVFNVVDEIINNVMRILMISM